MILNWPGALGAVLLIGLVSAGDQSDTSNYWPGFLGPPPTDLRAEDLPLLWSPDRSIAWKAAIPGYGQSSPVIWRQSAFVSSISGPMKDTCHVCAFGLRTGKKLWQRDFAAASTVANTNYVSKAAPTPVVDDTGLIVWFEEGNLIALEHGGKVRWERNLVEEYGEIATRHGLGSSLVQSQDHVFVWVERLEDPYLLAVDKATGTTRWKRSGLGAASWSTPALLPVGGGRHLVLSGSGKLVGFDPRTGMRLWSFSDISGNSIPSPQPVATGKLLIGATVGRGEESGGRAAGSNGLIDVATDLQGKCDVRFRWRCRRATSSFGSPILHEGLAYFVNQTGVLFCVDADTGSEVYTERLADSVWATPLAVGSRIYFPGRSGTTTVIQAGREFHKLAENRLWGDDKPDSAHETTGQGDPASVPDNEPVQYAIVAIPGCLLIRTGQSLYCISSPRDETMPKHAGRDRY